MKKPAFHNTISFRLTMWYTILIFILGIMLIVSINLAMRQARNEAPRWIMGSGNRSQAEIVEIVTDRYMSYLRLYSLVSFGGVVVIGGAGAYILSRRAFQTVDNVTLLAERISTTNLRERINYQGPDDEMKRLADTFDGMLTRLENAFESQKQFIQDASHELRTPIAIARTNIDVLEMDKKPTARDYKKLVEILKMSIERMNRLNDKLLVLSKENPDTAEWAEVNIALLVEDMITEFSANARSSQLNLRLAKTQGGLSVRGDAFSLKQVISNLIENAIRYNQPGGSIDVSAVRQGGKVIIKVKDSGIGISREDQRNIFDRFYRVDKSRSREQGGSGLGLAMVKKIVENHGGRITVESILGEGSIFSIELPAAGGN